MGEGPSRATQLPRERLRPFACLTHLWGHDFPLPPWRLSQKKKLKKRKKELNSSR